MMSFAEPQTPAELAAEWEAESPPPQGPVANFAASAVFAALGLAGLILSVRLGLGTPAEPSAGMWPFLTSLIILVLSLLQMVLGRRAGSGEAFTRQSWLAAIGFLTLLAMAALMPVVGFEIPAVLLSVSWMKFLGTETWRAAIVYSILIVAAFYGIFVAALGTSVPHLF